MKLFFKILVVIVLLLAALIIVLPFVFKGQIIELAKKEINANVNATVDFVDMDLSLIRNFPNFSLGIDGLTVVGNGEFQQDTLVSIHSIGIVIDLFSVFSGDSYEVKKIVIDSPDLKVRITESGKANYDIVPADDGEPENVEQEEETKFNLQLKHFQIINGSLSYEDAESATKLYIQGLNNSLSGDFSQDFTKLKTTTGINKLSFRQGGVDYLSDVSLKYRANIEADLKNEIYTLGKNQLNLNDLNLTFNGSVAMIEEGINLVLTFNAPDNRFKSLLSLIPAVYAKDFEDIRAEGKLSIDGSIKGIYDEDKLPAFNVNIIVDNGKFAYPDLPQSVTNINIIAVVSNKGGDADNTIIDVSQFSVNLGSNPFIASLLVKSPVSDPDIDAKIKGTLDLATLKDFYPVEDELSGTFIADITVKGKLSSIEKERYDEFIALGSLLVQNLNYTSTSFNKPVEISNAQLNFSPRYLDLVSFKMNAGNSDLQASGKVRNYLAYLFKNGDLKGDLTVRSKYFNLDELIAEGEKEEGGETQESTSDEEGADIPSESSVLEIPDKIDFTMNANFDKLVYDKIEMDNVKGKLGIRNRALILEDLQMGVAGGMMNVSGYYSTRNPEKPDVNLKFGIKDLNIPATYNKFAVMRTYLPVAKKTTGNFSASFNLKTSLDNQMMPVYETMNGSGQLNTSKITINDLNTLLQIAEALNFSEMKKLELDKLNVKFKFIDGKMMVNPFEINYKNINAEIEGWTSFDQSIGYVMDFNIPREELGAGANQMLEGLLKEANKLGGNFSLPETISFDVLVGGTLSKPTIKTGLAESGNDLVEKAKEEIIKEISKEVMEKAQQIINEADKQAKKIIAEAEKQAKYLRENADKAVAKLNAEYDKQADALMTEAKKQGFVAELAAKEAIRQLRKEADGQIVKLNGEADKQADVLINTAKSTARSIKQEAQKQADALLIPN